MLFFCLIDTYLFQPLLYIEAGAGFCRQFIMPDDPHIRKPPVEVLHVIREGFPLLRRTGVLGSLAVAVHAADVHDVPGCTIMPFCPIGNLPGIDRVVLVVLDQPLHCPVQMDHVGIADLLPAAAAFTWRGCMPTTDVCRRYFAAGRGGGAVDD